MTKIFLTLTALLLLTATPAFAENAENIQRDVIVKVDGMVCDFCAQSIQKVFGKQESVEQTFVDLDKGEIIVDLKDGQQLDDETITKLVVDSGYNVTEIKHGDK